MQPLFVPDSAWHAVPSSRRASACKKQRQRQSKAAIADRAEGEANRHQRSEWIPCTAAPKSEGEPGKGGGDTLNLRAWRICRCHAPLMALHPAGKDWMRRSARLVREVFSLTGRQTSPRDCPVWPPFEPYCLLPESTGYSPLRKACRADRAGFVYAKLKLTRDLCAFRSVPNDDIDFRWPRLP